MIREDTMKVGDKITIIMQDSRASKPKGEYNLPVSRVPQSGKIVLLNRLNDKSYSIKDGDRVYAEVILVKDTYLVVNPLKVLGNVKEYTGIPCGELE